MPERVENIRWPVNEQLEGGRWYPALHLPVPFLWRIKDAWLVLTNKAIAVQWPIHRGENAIHWDSPDPSEANDE